jgi:hypothetical protein
MVITNHARMRRRTLGKCIIIKFDLPILYILYLYRNMYLTNDKSTPYYKHIDTI